jgi:NAD(P)-dependent dehydrogenase (short-subunit alcohol dehydrogenase family)
MDGFEGARVVFTGAGGGLGRVLVARFAQAGARVVACDVAEADLSAEGIAERHRFDLRDAAATRAGLAAILAGGAPDVVVSNAGWTRAETLDMLDPARIAAEMDLNFTAAAEITLGCARAMRGAGGNRAIVAISSVNALSHHGNPAYSAAKAALMAWVRALAVEEGPHGIRANSVVPASIRTGAWEARLARDPAILDRLRAIYPLGRIVTPDEVAEAVLFLASPRASGITGAALLVDAGLAAGNLPFLDAIR